MRVCRHCYDVAYGILKNEWFRCLHGAFSLAGRTYDCDCPERILRKSFSNKKLNYKQSSPSVVHLVSKKHFIKAIENFSSALTWPHLNTCEVGRILKIYANPTLHLWFA